MQAYCIKTEIKNFRSGGIVCTPHPFYWGGGLNLQPNFQKGGGLDRTQLLERGCWERGDDFFQGGGVHFSQKNKLKSEIFNHKKGL